MVELTRIRIRPSLKTPESGYFVSFIVVIRLFMVLAIIGTMFQFIVRNIYGVVYVDKTCEVKLI